MKALLLVAVLALFFSAGLQAEEANDQFVRIYNLIRQADALNENGDHDLARQKYFEAQADLKTLRQTHPDWNAGVVGFRLGYVAEKLESFAQPDHPTDRARLVKQPGSPSAAGESAGLVQLLQEQVRRLTADKELLQARLKEALTAQPAAVDPRDLAAAQEKIRALQKEVEVLKVNLDKAETKPDKPIDPAVLEETRKSLAEATQKVAQQAEIVAALTLEKEALQTRLRTELIALKAGTVSDPSSGGPSPEASGQLLPEAQRAFAARRFEEAEEKYSQALRLDEKNVTLRSNLAAAQIEQNRFAEAEENLKQALAAAPKDVGSLSLFGLLKIRQGNYDEALEALSQAAQLDPQNADAFQSLGIVLAEKGLREPAESAFRRAIQLAPANGDAHHNLAVIYANHQPPALELARWHYQKALASGHPIDSKLEQLLKR